MSRTVYVVERVVFDVSEYQGVSFHDWTGSNGDHTARVPVAAFADRAAAEAEAARLGRAALAGVSPARFGAVVPEPHQSAVRAALRRHGLDPPVFHHWTRDGYRGVPFPDWWAAHAHALAPAAVAEVGAALVGAEGLYRVEARELVED